MTVELGLIRPPVGMNVFVIKIAFRSSRSGCRNAWAEKAQECSTWTAAGNAGRFDRNNGVAAGDRHLVIDHACHAARFADVAWRRWPAGRPDAEEGRLAARLRRPRWRDLPHQLLGQMRVRGAAGAAGAAVTFLAVAAAASAARSAEVDFTSCASCHGSDGVSYNVDTPSLAGQPSFYAITQLFLFRAGRRTSPLMTEMARTMSDADLIGRLPPAPPAPAAPADPARLQRGAALAERHRCTSCHGDELAGDKQVPRLAGQREEYLARALAEFRAGTRVGYTPAMNETLAGLDAVALDDLAHYIAHAPAPVAAGRAALSPPR